MTVFLSLFCVSDFGNKKTKQKQQTKQTNQAALYRTMNAKDEESTALL